MNLPLKWHGGKHYLAAQIVALMPKHLTYVEPFFGGGSVLFAHDPEGVSEVVNDLNSDLTNFWRVLQDDMAFTAFKQIVEATPFSEEEYRKALRRLRLDDLDVRHAAKFFIACRQSLAGRQKSFASISKARVRRGMNEQVSAWLTAIEGLPAVHARLKRVLILNRDALKVIQEFDSSTVVQYLDPPYLPDTRTAPEVYDVMTECLWLNF